MSRRNTLERPARGNGRVLVGVCAALARRFDVSPTTVRLLFIVFGLVGAGEVVYLLLWIVVPPARR